jgi:hypothetical protein
MFYYNATNALLQKMKIAEFKIENPLAIMVARGILSKRADGSVNWPCSAERNLPFGTANCLRPIRSRVRRRAGGLVEKRRDVDRLSTTEGCHCFFHTHGSLLACSDLSDPFLPYACSTT